MAIRLHRAWRPKWAHFSLQWANFGIFYAVLYVATEDGKISRAPTEYKWLQGKTAR